jgi:hypothetical protein
MSWRTRSGASPKYRPIAAIVMPSSVRSQYISRSRSPVNPVGATRPALADRSV